MGGEEKDRREFDKCPRWDKHELSDAQIQSIAKSAATNVVAEFKNGMKAEIKQELEDAFYINIGHAVVRKVMWVIGVFSIIVFVVMIKFGWVKIP